MLTGQYTLTVALGMGTVTAAASLLLALGYQKLPFGRPGELVAVWVRGNPGANVEALSGPDVADLASGAAQAFSVLAPFLPAQQTLVDRIGSVAVPACAIDERGLEALDLTPVAGRAVTRYDKPAGSPDAPAWIGEEFWHQRYASDPSVLGQVIQVGSGGQAMHLRIVGVLPRKATIPLPFATGELDLWYLLPDMSKRPRAAPGLLGVGRLRPGVNAQEGTAALRVTTDRLGGRYAFERNKLPVVAGLVEIAEGPARRTMGLLTLGIGLVFLVACANLAVLMVAEGAQRKREFAIRTALGANRRQLWGEAALESCALTAIALAAGLGLAFAFTRGLAVLVPSAGIGAAMGRTPPLSVAVAAAFCAAALAAALLWSAIVVTAGDREGPAHSLASGGASALHTGASGRWRLGLLALQAALGICLFAAAALASRTYAAVSAAQLGPAPRQTVLFDFAPRHGAQLDDTQASRFKQAVQARIAQLSGIQQLALADRIPPAGSPATFVVQGDARLRTTSPGLAVTSGYFRALGIPVLYGRGLLESDSRPGASQVTVISREMAARNWPEPRQAVGSRIALGSKADKPYLIVGVVGDFTGYWFQAPVPQMYLPEADSTYQSATAIVRTAAEPEKFAALARQVLATMPMPATVAQVRTMQSAWNATLTRPFARTLGMLLLALLGLGLSLQGIYAVAAANATARTHELAVRSALGGAPRHLIWTVTRGPALTVLAGGAAGVIAALGLEPVLAHWLGPHAVWRIEPVAAAVAILVLAAVAACIAPARRATRANPADILRIG